MKMELDNIAFNFQHIPFEETVETTKARMHQIKMKTVTTGNRLIWIKENEGGVHLTQMREDKSTDVEMDKIGSKFKVNEEPFLFHCFISDDPTDNPAKAQDLVVLLHDNKVAAMPNVWTSHIVEWQPYEKGVEPTWEGHMFAV